MSFNLGILSFKVGILTLRSCNNDPDTVESLMGTIYTYSTNASYDGTCNYIYWFLHDFSGSLVYKSVYFFFLIGRIKFQYIKYLLMSELNVISLALYWDDHGKQERQH